MEKWLSDLKAQIIDEKDSKNFDDIIKCYQDGLLRAGFLMAWLMLVESLKRKIVELADKGVKVATIELKTITTTEDAMHSNDEVIWKGALKCELITKEEDSVLEMLWKKRCIMSHPYMPEVNESDFRYMVEKLVSISLSRTLMWSKPMIDDYFSDIRANVFLIPDESAEQQEAADRILKLVPEKLWPFFWKTLFYELSLSLEGGHNKLQKMLKRLAIRFVRQPGLDINDSCFTLANKIKDHCGVCWNIFSNKRAWGKLNEDYQAQMFRFLKDNKKEAKKVLCLAYDLIDSDDSLDEKFIECYYEALAEYDVTDMQSYYLDKKRFLKILYDEKIKGYQFSDQGEFIDMLKSMEEDDLEEFTVGQRQKMGRYVEMCCVNGTFKAHDFVRSRNIWIKDLNFVKGLAIEGLTDEKGNLSVSKRHLEHVVPALFYTKEETIPEVVASLEELPVVETMKEAMICKNMRMEVKRYFEEDSDEGKALLGVVNKYCVGYDVKPI